MSELLQDVTFWTAVTSLGWPVAAITIALLFRRYLARLIDGENVTIKVAGMEISVREAAAQAGKNLSDLQERVARLEEGVVGVTDPNDVQDGSDGISILWVDDFPSNNAFIIEKLESDGYRVRKELTTDAGLKALATDNFGIIISDLGRQEGGQDNPFAGLEFTRAVRAANNDTPLLIFAGKRGHQNRERLLAAGVTQVTSSAVDVFRFVDAHGPRARRGWAEGPEHGSA